MDDSEQAEYSGAETTGFQSPAQDHIEHVIDLSRLLDLQKPGIYPVRVSGQAFAERGIRDGDILIANTAARPAHGKVVVAVLQGSFRLATLERRGAQWFLRASATKEALPVVTRPKSGPSSPAAEFRALLGEEVCQLAHPSILNHGSPILMPRSLASWLRATDVILSIL